MDRYELVEGSSAKFWQVEVRGSDLVVEYGRLGTKGQSTTKSFDSPAAAQAAAAKLVKEKTGKGYCRVDGPAAASEAEPAKQAKPAKREKPLAASEATGSAQGSAPAMHAGEAVALPDGITEAMLSQLVAKLGKKSKKAPRDIADDVVGTDEVGTWGRRTYASNAAIAILIDRGQWPQKLVPEVLSAAVSGWAFIRPQTLLALVRRPDFDESLAERALMRLGTADPSLLAPANDGSLPPEPARRAPLVRRRLGLSTEPISDELADWLAANFVGGTGGSVGGEIARDGRCLVDRWFDSYAAYRDYVVETLGITKWDEHVRNAAEEHSFGAAWRIEPSFLSAPVGELAQLLDDAGEVDGTLLFRWLESRNDAVQDLVAVVEAMSPGDPTWGNRHAHQAREALAVVAGARLAEAGKPIPDSLVKSLWFIDNLPPTRLNAAYARALAKWPAAKVHARVRQLIKPPKVPQDIDSSDDVPLPAPVRGAVALAVHPDAALLKQLLDSLTWNELHDAAAYVGRLGLEHLPDLLARQARHGSKSASFSVAIQTMLVNAAETSGKPFGAEHDVHFQPSKCANRAPWQRAVTLLPQARRDTYFLEWAKRDPFEHQPQLYLVGDETLDAIVGLMFSMRNAEDVGAIRPHSVSFGSVGRTLWPCGPRVVAMIEKHARASGGDHNARELLAQMPIQPETYAALLGKEPPAPASEELDASTAHRLTELLGALEVEGTIPLGSGVLMVATSGHAPPRTLPRGVPKGSAKLLVHYEDVEGSTAGLAALCLRFGDAQVARWEEIPRLLADDLVGVILGDEASFAKLGDADRDALDELIQAKVAHGDAVGVHKKKLVAAYVGEEPVDPRVFWGLDAAGQPACVLASFAGR